MILLLVKDDDNAYSLYCPDTYGVDTWGQTAQDGINYKDGKYYLTSWSAGNEYVDESYEEFEINVVLETENIDNIVQYFVDHKLPGLSYILDEFAEIVKTYVAFTKWLIGSQMPEMKI